MTGDLSADTLSDNDLQDILDAHRLEVRREKLESRPMYASGSAEYYDFYSAHHDFEETDGGTAVFVLEDSTGLNRSTADWTANYVGGHVQFSGDQAGTAVYLTGRSYDLHGAAADVWRRVQGNKAALYDFSADGAKMSRSQWFEHCGRMAAHYDRLARPMVATMVRGDVS
jgi:hypothetical protein